MTYNFEPVGAEKPGDVELVSRSLNTLSITAAKFAGYASCLAEKGLEDVSLEERLQMNTDAAFYTGIMLGLMGRWKAAVRGDNE